MLKSFCAYQLEEILHTTVTMDCPKKVEIIAIVGDTKTRSYFSIFRRLSTDN